MRGKNEKLFRSRNSFYLFDSFKLKALQVHMMVNDLHARKFDTQLPQKHLKAYFLSQKICQEICFMG